MKKSFCRSAASALTVLIASVPLAGWAATQSGLSNGTFSIFTADSSGAPPAARTIVGPISDHLCRRPWDMAASDAEALAPLEARARALGANGLVDVKFDRHRIDLKSKCWQQVTVTGTAVVFGGASGH